VAKKKASKKKAAGAKEARSASKRTTARKTTASKASTSKAAGKKTTKKKTTKAAGGNSVRKKSSGQVKKAGSQTRKVAPVNNHEQPVGVTGTSHVPSPNKRPSIFREPIPQQQEEKPAPSEAQLRRVKTGLKKKDLAYFRQLLLDKRHELIGDMAGLEESAGNNGGGNLSHMPMHMADIGSDNYEQEFTLGLVESERRLLREIDDALRRIAGGTYGVCVETARPITRDRLEAKPWAKYSIEIAREKERTGQR